MKKFIPTLIAIILLASCKSSKDYLLRGDEDKTLYDIVKKLNKQGSDADATAALPVVYKQVQQRHLKKITTYNNYNEISKWDKLYSEYNILQNMYDAIDNSPAARQLIAPANYYNEITDIKQSAAQDYYQLGENYLQVNNRENAKRAYSAFKKSDSWVKDFKDSKAKMDEAYNSSIVNVLVNPVQDNSFFFNTGWGNTGYNFSNEYFQQNLIRDLGGKYATRYPARFYTEWEARRDNIEPDWVVDLTLRNMDIPRPSVYNYTRNVSKQIQSGKDTSGKPVYQTVYATLNIQKLSFNARAQMDVNIVEVASRRNIAYNSYTDNYNWLEEKATFTGDRRALSDNDWTLVNNNFNNPTREDILNRLYRNIYPQVKNRISNEVDW
jgi:hypothetical protein